MIFPLYLECPLRNCSDCEEGICRECNDDFVLLRSDRSNKTSCEPCGRKLKIRKPAVFLQHCVTGKHQSFTLNVKFWCSIINAWSSIVNTRQCHQKVQVLACPSQTRLSRITGTCLCLEPSESSKLHSPRPLCKVTIFKSTQTGFHVGSLYWSSWKYLEC